MQEEAKMGEARMKEPAPTSGWQVGGGLWKGWVWSVLGLRCEVQLQVEGGNWKVPVPLWYA